MFLSVLIFFSQRCLVDLRRNLHQVLTHDPVTSTKATRKDGASIDDPDAEREATQSNDDEELPNKKRSSATIWLMSQNALYCVLDASPPFTKVLKRICS